MNNRIWMLSELNSSDEFASFSSFSKYWKDLHFNTVGSDGFGWHFGGLNRRAYDGSSNIFPFSGYVATYGFSDYWQRVYGYVTPAVANAGWNIFGPTPSSYAPSSASYVTAGVQYTLNSTYSRLNHVSDIFDYSSRSPFDYSFAFFGAGHSNKSIAGYVTGGVRRVFTVYESPVFLAYYKVEAPGGPPGWRYSTDTTKLTYSTQTFTFAPSAALPGPVGYPQGFDTSKNPTNNGYVLAGFYAEASKSPSLPADYFNYSSFSYSDIRKINYSTESFTTIPGKTTRGRDDFAIGTDQSSKAYLIGGFSGFGSANATCEKFTVSTESSSSTPSLPEARYGVGAIGAPASVGKLFFAGGFTMDEPVVGGFPIQFRSVSNYGKISYSTDTLSQIPASLITISPAQTGARKNVNGTGSETHGYFGYGWNNFGYPSGGSVLIGSSVWYEIEKFNWSTETNQYTGIESPSIAGHGTVTTKQV